MINQTALSANGNSEEFVTASLHKPLRVYLGDTFGGGTATLQIRLSDGTWVSTGQTATAAGWLEFNIEPGNRFRINLAGATAPSLGIHWDG